MSLERGTTTRLSLKHLSRKFSLRNRDYDKVDDLYDTRLPLHNEDAFQHGIRFKAKYIGSLEIARPTCKIDIITAMRRIRYEYKVKGTRKVRCALQIATSGVKVSKRKSKRSRKKYTEDQLFMMHHPIYRIFYVSHDSQDLKIFSYITREVPGNTFRCNVFKAYKKSMALHIVRSLGQAFDVCHKLNPKPAKNKKKEEGEKEAAEEGEEQVTQETKESEATPAQPADGPANDAKEVSTDLDAAVRNMTLENGEPKTLPTEMQLNKDLISLQFDPFAVTSTPYPNPNNAFLAMSVPNGDTMAMNFDPFQSNFTPRPSENFVTPSIPPPPLMMTNTSTILPDLPEEGDISQLASIPPPHLAYISRPRPRPGTHHTVIQENPFTEAIPGNESPVSIGEPLSTIPEGTSGRKLSNPFRPTEEGRSAWELEKQQFTAQMTLLREQLKTETTARIESQARVEHLLLQNKELLSHLQKLMVQLQQLQSLQLPAQGSSTSSPPPPSTSSPPPPSTSSPPPPSTSIPRPPSATTPPPTSTPPTTTVPTPPPPTSTSPIPVETAPVLDTNSGPSSESPILPVTTSPLLADSFIPFSSPNPGSSELGDALDLVGPATNDPFTPVQLNTTVPIASS